MWKACHRKIHQQITKTTLNDGSRSLSYGEVVALWHGRESFCQFFSCAIVESEFGAFFWETPPVTSQTLDRPFEFVLVESAALMNLRPDPTPFSAHFSSQQTETVLTFPNLGGDAVLVVPAPRTETNAYTHLANFLREAPQSQVGAFWYTVGMTMQSRVSNSPTWLSTAGLGVSWLHLRLDSRPKYYRYEPYKAERH